jgi:hypothetical protein
LEEERKEKSEEEKWIYSSAKKLGNIEQKIQKKWICVW